MIIRGQAPGSRLQAPGGHRPELSYDQASLGAKPQQQVAPPQRPQQQQHLQQWATAGARNVKCGGKQFTYLQSFIDRKEEERRLADLMWGPATSSAAGPCHECHVSRVSRVTCVTCHDSCDPTAPGYRRLGLGGLQQAGLGPGYGPPDYDYSNFVSGVTDVC